MDWSKNANSPGFQPTFFAHPKPNDATRYPTPTPIFALLDQPRQGLPRIAEAMGAIKARPVWSTTVAPDGPAIPARHPKGPVSASCNPWTTFSPSPSTRLLQDAVNANSSVRVKTRRRSHEFYNGYASPADHALPRHGPFPPTETIHDKISSSSASRTNCCPRQAAPSAGHDHVVILNDDIRNLFQQIVRGDYLSKTNIALDFFDASINRIGAWVVGTRAAKKGLLCALLEPTAMLNDFENNGDGAMKLAMLENSDLPSRCRRNVLPQIWHAP